MQRKDFIKKISWLVVGVSLPFGKVWASVTETSCWRELLEYARWCPSPHNVQPWRVKIASATEAQLFYDPARVPIVVDSDSAFTTVGMGMFLECMRIAALDKGFRLEAEHVNEWQMDGRSKDLKLFASLRLYDAEEKSNINPQLIIERRTSRIRYTGKEVAPRLLQRYKDIVSGYGHVMDYTAQPDAIHSIADLNNRTELIRSDDKPTMQEMSRWIRTSDAEAAEKKDGLWYRCLDLRAKTLHNFIYHHRRFHSKWKRKLMSNMLNKGMGGTPVMAWISGPFASRNDWLAAGAMLQRLWLAMTEDNIYIHPLGTTITTPQAKEELITQIGYRGDSEKLWFLVRLGYSEQPQRSYRLSVSDILVA